MRLHLGYASHYGSQREGHQTPLFTLARRLTDSSLKSRAKCTKNTSKSSRCYGMTWIQKAPKLTFHLGEVMCTANTAAMFDLLLKRR